MKTRFLLNILTIFSIIAFLFAGSNLYANSSNTQDNRELLKQTFVKIAETKITKDQLDLSKLSSELFDILEKGEDSEIINLFLNAYQKIEITYIEDTLKVCVEHNYWLLPNNKDIGNYNNGDYNIGVVELLCSEKDTEIPYIFLDDITSYFNSGCFTKTIPNFKADKLSIIRVFNHKASFKTKTKDGWKKDSFSVVGMLNNKYRIVQLEDSNYAKLFSTLHIPIAKLKD